MYFVYVMSSKSRVLHTGVTRDLGRRVEQHRSAEDPYAFCTRYRVYQLVYWEEYTFVHDAIARETQIKAWTRAKRVVLVDDFNREWRDLYPTAAQIPRRLRGSE